ncbi:DUF3796 domain-containing protein [Marasmitruncus massiliensis]|uniref:DUF3796 domain-containing protein n=1 Tax=Marasmitruncus massiliensis TaxID=1944642 RepID=UPI0011AF815E|nr:DUF3796 domain-containing protein [Marasmitruncus massiliensis]
MKHTVKNRRMWMGFLGLFGLQGFSYFWTGEATDLCAFAWFAYFSYFWLARLHVELPDERYREDVKTAKAFAFQIASFELFVLFLLVLILPESSTLLTLAVSICVAVLILSYAAKLYQLEEK